MTSSKVIHKKQELQLHLDHLVSFPSNTLFISAKILVILLKTYKYQNEF